MDGVLAFPPGKGNTQSDICRPEDAGARPSPREITSPNENALPAAAEEGILNAGRCAYCCTVSVMAGWVFSMPVVVCSASS